MLFSFLAAVIGALTTLQSRFNGQLSTDIHNGIAAAILSFITGWIVLIGFCFFYKPDRDGLKIIWSSLRNRTLKWWEILGGMGGGFFVALQSSLVPTLGVAIFTICIVGGQTTLSIFVDLIGLSPSGKHRVTAIRVITSIVILISVSIAVYPDLRNSTFKFAPILLTILVGGIVAFQQALNGRVNVISKRPLATTFVNFLMGTLVLIVALAVNLGRGGHIGPLPHNLWVYMGGPLGLIFIALSAFIVKQLGVLNFVLFSVSGQLLGGLIIDWIAPAAHTHITSYLITGTAMTLVAVVSSRFLTRFQNKSGERAVTN
jgi:transporter family-2 protein